MLQTVKNQQTLKILERLRKQGAPASAGSNDQDLEMSMGPDNEVGTPPPSPQDADPNDPGLEPEGQDWTVQDSGMPSGTAMGALNIAKRKLRRRS